MSTLKVNKLRDTTGSTDAIVLDPSGGAVLAGVTTISTARITTGITTSIQVGGGVTISESGIEASGIGITCASINDGAIGGRRNLIINGAMLVAQRGTSSTNNSDFTADRFQIIFSGTDESPTHAQADVSSGTTPYTLGFRKSLKITNGNQTSGAGVADYLIARYQVEAQDMANSGWNYTSASSYVTLSFWIKSSVAQNFYFNLISGDGPLQNYAYETGSLTADTWTKVTKTIPGNSNVQFNNDNGSGLQLDFWAYGGTNYTASGVALNQWAAYSSGNRMPDITTTWYTTNDATLEITGVQLELGPQATPFEHRSFGEEMNLCERYFQVMAQGDSHYLTNCMFYSNTVQTGVINFKTQMRTTPTLYQVTVSNGYVLYHNGNGDSFNSFTGGTALSQDAGAIYISGSVTGTAGHCGGFYLNDASCFIAMQSEL